MSFFAQAPSKSRQGDMDVLGCLIRGSPYTVIHDFLYHNMPLPGGSVNTLKSLPCKSSPEAKA